MLQWAIRGKSLDQIYLDAQHWLMPLAVSLVVYCVGVALSVLGGNAGSLVGVAISASLLPPAVNAGLFWALALVLASGGKREREREKSLRFGTHRILLLADTAHRFIRSGLIPVSSVKKCQKNKLNISSFYIIFGFFWRTTLWRLGFLAFLCKKSMLHIFGRTSGLFR